MEQNKNPISKEQTISLVNRKNLSVSGVNKIISLKPELIQLDTVFGGLVITGSSLELVKLDNNINKADIVGEVNCLRFVEGKDKQPFFRKLFK
mgnify:FL=1